MLIGDKLKKLRTEKGLTQSQLGEIASISYIQIGRYEKNKSKPTSKIVKKLAEALEVDTDYFFEDNTEKDIDINEVKSTFKTLFELIPEDSANLYSLNQIGKALIFQAKARKELL